MASTSCEGKDDWMVQLEPLLLKRRSGGTSSADSVFEYVFSRFISALQPNFLSHSC